MTMGGLTAILLMLMWQLLSSRRVKFRKQLGPQCLKEFKTELATLTSRW